jgi:hypothetical protein
MSLYGQQYTNELLPFQADLTATEDRVAREASGYLQAFQDQLSAQLAGINSIQQFEQQKSLDAQQQIYKLAQMEKDYQYNASLARISNQGSSGTATERATAEARQSYQNEVSKAKTTYVGQKGKFLIFASRYADQLPTADLYNIWAQYSGYGPATETVSELQDYLKSGL